MSAADESSRTAGIVWKRLLGAARRRGMSSAGQLASEPTVATDTQLGLLLAYFPCHFNPCRRSRSRSSGRPSAVPQKVRGVRKAHTMLCRCCRRCITQHLHQRRHRPRMHH